MIAILAGMLLPALNAAKEKAKAISCAGNLKTMGSVLSLYTDTYNGFFPNDYIYEGKNQRLYYYYLLSANLLKLPASPNVNPKVTLKKIICPSAPPPEDVYQVYGMRNWKPNTYAYYSYPYIALRNVSNTSCHWLNFNSAQNKGFSKMPMFMDSMTMIYGKPTQYYASCCFDDLGKTCGGLWHNKKMNAVMADGHVEPLRIRDMGKNDMRIRYAGDKSGRIVSTRGTD